MKKTLCLLGAVLVTSTVTISCSKQEDTPRNYYGVQPENNGTPKQAYYTLFGALIAFSIFLLVMLKKLKNKK